MTPPNSAPDPREDRDIAAANWFARKRSGAMTMEDARAFEVWLAADPENRAAYDAIDLMWSIVEDIRADPTVLAIREEAQRPAQRPRGLMIGAGIAAAVALAGLSGWAGWQAGFFAAPKERTFQTVTGQTSTYTLDDGSIITLDTDTVLHATLSGDERHIVLEKGRAFFRVAPDKSRPFVVAAEGNTVTAVGTAFDVRAEDKRFEVTLIEGKLRVAAPPEVSEDGFRRLPQTAEMSAGSKLVAKPDGEFVLERIDAVRETSWLYGQLIFVAEPLGEVAAELNRYSARKVVVEDADVAAAPISGSFEAGDVAGFVRAVKEYRLARVNAETPGEVHLGAP